MSFPVVGRGSLPSSDHGSIGPKPGFSASEAPGILRNIIFIDAFRDILADDRMESSVFS
jgi:hypothetical protein